MTRYTFSFDKLIRAPFRTYSEFFMICESIFDSVANRKCNFCWRHRQNSWRNIVMDLASWNGLKISTIFSLLTLTSYKYSVVRQLLEFTLMVFIVIVYGTWFNAIPIINNGVRIILMVLMSILTARNPAINDYRQSWSSTATITILPEHGAGVDGRITKVNMIMGIKHCSMNDWMF